MRPKENTQPATPVALALKVDDRCLVVFGEDRDVHGSGGTVSFSKDSEPHEGIIKADQGDSWLVLIAGTELSIPKAWATVSKA